MKQKALALVLSTLLGCSAFAADSGLYVGIDGGYNNIGSNTGTRNLSLHPQTLANGSVISAGTNHREHGNAWTAGAYAGYLFPITHTGWLFAGPQIGYRYYGDVNKQSFTNGTQSALLTKSLQSINVYADVTAELSTFWRGSVKLGMADFMGKEKGTGSISGVDFSSAAGGSYSHWRPIMQLGVGYKLTSKIIINGFFTHVFGTNTHSSTTVPSMSIWGLGATVYL